MQNDSSMRTIARNQAGRSVLDWQFLRQPVPESNRAGRDGAGPPILPDENLSASQSRIAAAHPALSGRAGAGVAPGAQPQKNLAGQSTAPHAAFVVCWRRI